MSDTKRTASFIRNNDLERLLSELNNLLSTVNLKACDDFSERHTKIFIVGALRSGTTLFTQWLASTGAVAYPTNLLSRFYGAPLIGAKIQQLLTDQRYNYRNEILDFNSNISFESENGKTRGALAPNEFWYFWRRFLPFSDLDYLPDDELIQQGDMDGLHNELNGISNIFEKPFALKAMIMNQNLLVLDQLFKNSLFIWIKRDPVYNIQSVLNARQRQYGDINTWYSFKIREYEDLKERPPLESAVGQVLSINNSIQTAMSELDEYKKLFIPYEDFCDRPRQYYQTVIEKLTRLNPAYTLSSEYQGPQRFENTNKWTCKDFTESDVRTYLQSTNITA
ncbi:MAG: sulfotransferase [Candidatus Thiodiazotropha sp.]